MKGRGRVRETVRGKCRPGPHLSFGSGSVPAVIRESVADCSFNVFYSRLHGIDATNSLLHWLACVTMGVMAQQTRPFAAESIA